MKGILKKATSSLRAAKRHVGALLILLAVSTVIVFLMPINISAIEIYVWVIPVFALYLGLSYLLSGRRRVQHRARGESE